MWTEDKSVIDSNWYRSTVSLNMATAWLIHKAHFTQAQVKDSEYYKGGM